MTLVWAGLTIRIRVCESIKILDGGLHTAHGGLGVRFLSLRRYLVDLLRQEHFVCQAAATVRATDQQARRPPGHLAVARARKTQVPVQPLNVLLLDSLVRGAQRLELVRGKLTFLEPAHTFVCC